MVAKKYHLQWQPGEEPQGANFTDFDSEKEVIDYVQRFLPKAHYAGPWLPSFGTTDQYKRIFNPKNGIDEEVGKVIELADVAQQLPDTTLCPPPKNPKI